MFTTNIYTSKPALLPLSVSADRQETFSISGKVEFDKARAHRELGACGPALYTAAGKERRIFFFSNQVKAKGIKTQIIAWFRLQLHSGKWCTLTQSLILEARTRAEDLRRDVTGPRPPRAQPYLSPASGRSADLQESELSSSSPQLSHARATDQLEDVMTGQAPFIVAREERQYLKINITRSVQHRGDENLKTLKMNPQRETTSPVPGKDSTSLGWQLALS